jgi:Ankyrin repeats (3 copies)
MYVRPVFQTFPPPLLPPTMSSLPSESLSSRSLTYTEFATTTTNDDDGYLDEQFAAVKDHPVLNALHRDFKTATILDYAFACKHGYIYPCLQSFSVAELEAVVDPLEFWQFPVAWSRAVQEEAAFKQGDYTGPVLGPIARDGATRLMRVRNTFNPKVLFEIADERALSDPSSIGQRYAFFHCDPSMFVLLHHYTERPREDQEDRTALEAYVDSCVVEAGIVSNAVKYNEIDILRYLDKHGYNVAKRDYIYATAAEEGHLDCLKYLREIGAPWRRRVCYFAARKGNLDCLKYLHENGCPWDDDTVNAAVMHGHMECLKYAYENGCPLNESLIHIAAYNNRMDCVKYLHEIGAPLNESACANAAVNGNLAMLKYLREIGCPWDHRTCSQAARGGHLECLKYAHENGCPWDILTRLRAQYNENADCLKYAEENGCPQTWLDPEDENEWYDYGRVDYWD